MARLFPVVVAAAILLALLPGHSHAQSLNNGVSGPTTNPLGSGFSLANGSLFVPVNTPMAATQVPFGYSYNMKTTAAPTGNVYWLSSTTNPVANGFFSQWYPNANYDSYRFKNLIGGNPNLINSGATYCETPGCLRWRYEFLNDGNVHNVCVGWTTAGGYLYVDGILRDTNGSATVVPPTDTLWYVGYQVPTPATMFDLRVFNHAPTAEDCVTLGTLALSGEYPTSGSTNTGMSLHLPLDNCVLAAGNYTCADTSGNGNVASTQNGAPVGIVILTPSAGTVSGTSVSITASCTQTGSVCSQVCYYMDGMLLNYPCATNSGTSFPFAWNSQTAIDGPHSLTAVGYNAVGGTITSAAVAVTVSNGLPATTYYFNSSAGSDSNDCLAATTVGGHGPCQTITKYNSTVIRGGDTANFVGTGFAGPLLVCGPAATAPLPNPFFGGSPPVTSCGGQNYYPSSSRLTITGPNTCNALTGSSGSVPANCANIDGGVQTWNGSNVTVQNTAELAGASGGTFGILVQTTPMPYGSSANVTLQNNFVYGFQVEISSNYLLGNGTFTDPTKFGPITNLQILDNYITAAFGASNSPDQGVYLQGHTQALVQGNVTENAGGSNGNSQGNGLVTDNWPNPGGAATPTIFQFNVTHDNGGNYSGGEGGPYSLYSNGGDYTTFQFNEEYNQRCWYSPGFPACSASNTGPDDGGADMDTGSTHILMQYNYIHDNIQKFSNGMLLFIGTTNDSFPSNPNWGDNYYRYNILENYFTGQQANEGNTSGAVLIGGHAFYNNTLSTNTSASDPGGTQFTGTCNISAYSFNNLCINTATTGYALWYNAQNGGFCGINDYDAYYAPTLQPLGQAGWIANFTFYNTLASWQSAAACNNTTADAHSLFVTTNPLSGTANTGGTCWPGGSTPPAGPTQPPSAANCPAVYQLKTGSALIGVGRDMHAYSSAITNPTRDFYGNTTPNGVGSGWNIGADGGHH